METISYVQRKRKIALNAMKMVEFNKLFIKIRSLY